MAVLIKPLPLSMIIFRQKNPNNALQGNFNQYYAIEYSRKAFKIVVSNIWQHYYWTHNALIINVLVLVLRELNIRWHVYSFYMMTSSNGNIFRITGHLCREFTGHRWIPYTKASDAELWYFLRCFFFLFWLNGWVNNREAGDLWHHRAHYDVIVMIREIDHYCFTLYCTSMPKLGTPV